MYVGLHFAHNPNRGKRRRHKHRHKHRGEKSEPAAEEHDTSKPRKDIYQHPHAHPSLTVAHIPKF